MGAEFSQTSKDNNNNNNKRNDDDPCTVAIQAYVQCMTIHEGKKPDPYEPEFCNAEKDLYRACRAQLKQQRLQQQQQKQHTE